MRRRSMAADAYNNGVPHRDGVAATRARKGRYTLRDDPGDRDVTEKANSDRQDAPLPRDSDERRDENGNRRGSSSGFCVVVAVAVGIISCGDGKHKRDTRGEPAAR